MVHLPAVFGKWVIRDGSWYFEIDMTKGGRMFFLKDGCTYGELVGMIQDDYNLDTNHGTIEISYPLPDVMLKQLPMGTPPNIVANDGQVFSLIELSRGHVVRLCVSSKPRSSGASREEVEAEGDADGEETEDEDWEDMDEDVDEDDDDLGEFVVDEDVKNEDVEKGNVNDQENVEEKADVYDSDVDYGVFGKVKGEEAEYEYDASFDLAALTSTGGVNGMGGMYGNWSDQLLVKKCFRGKAELVTELRTTAVMEKFAYRVAKSEPELFVAKCKLQGCKWMLRASVKHEPNTFWVTKYKKVHTCSLANRTLQRKRCGPKHIAKLFMDRFGIIDRIVPMHIQVSMGNFLGLKMSYTTAYRSWIFAQELVRGTAEEGYNKLPSYLQLIEKVNPGSVTDIVRGKENRFKYLFLSLGASIAGFQYLRRVIVVDGTHLNGKYEGVLLVAAGQDANFQIFPLAFGIVDAEDDDSWEWFFSNLRRCFSDEQAMVIVSDRHSSIAKACANVLPWATRGICYYHLQQNIVSKHKGKDIMYLVKGAAYAYTVEDYDRYMAAIRHVKPDIADYLEEADPRLWSRVHFPGDRFNIKTSNIAESLNSALKVAKGFPIIYLLEFIREKLGRWFYKRREDALSLTTAHSRGVETLLAIRNDYAERMSVQRIDRWRFQVRGRGKRDCLVDLEQGVCSCGMFQIEKIPCSHVLAAATNAGVSMNAFVWVLYGKDYLFATYAGNVMPIDEETKPGDVPLNPPLVKRGPGRAKKSRWQTWLELSRRKGNKPRKLHKQYKCSKCKQPGHTRPHCVREALFCAYFNLYQTYIFCLSLNQVIKDGDGDD